MKELLQAHEIASRVARQLKQLPGRVIRLVGPRRTRHRHGALQLELYTLIGGRDLNKEFPNGYLIQTGWTNGPLIHR